MADFGNYDGYTWEIDCSLPLPLFHGLTSEIPYLHIDQLEEVCSGNVGVLLRVFPSSLRDSALEWFLACSRGPVHSWGELRRQFLNKFSPGYETQMLLQELSYFYQRDDESFSQCWERFKNVVFSWSSFNCELGDLLIIFCQGLNTKACYFDLFSDDEFLDKSAEDGWDYLDELAQRPQLCDFIDMSKITNLLSRGDEMIEPLVACDEPLPLVEPDDQIPMILEEVSPPIESSPLHELIIVERIDFLGVDEFDAVSNPFLLNLINNLKINFGWNLQLVELHFQARLKKRKYSKYLILWHGRVQFLKEDLSWSDLLMLLACCSIADNRISREGSAWHCFSFYFFYCYFFLF